MRHHSLLMGVQDYRGSPGLAPLSCARADVELMASVFGDPTLMGGETRVQKVLDPTYDEAKRSLRAFFDGVDREDVVVLYFSGHGMRDASGGLFLCLTDSDENDLELTALPFQTLGNVLRNKFLQRVVVLLDCCYSGAAGFKDSMKSKFDEAEQVLENGKGTFILSSSGHAQTSKEGDGNSIFTRALVEGIRSGAADMDEDGHISVQEIADYIAMEVPRHTPGQDPQVSSRAARGTFLVAVHEARKRAHEERLQAGAPPTDSDLGRDILRAARSRLIRALETGDVRKDFFDDVHDWITSARDPSLGSAHMQALRAYGAEEIGLMQLHDLWRKSGQTTTMAPSSAFAEAPQGFAAQATGLAPEPVRVRMADDIPEAVDDPELVEQATGPAPAPSVFWENVIFVGGAVLGLIVIGAILWFAGSWAWSAISDWRSTLAATGPAPVPDHLLRYDAWAVGYKGLVVAAGIFGLLLLFGTPAVILDEVLIVETFTFIFGLVAVVAAVALVGYLIVSPQPFSQNLNGMFLWFMDIYDTVAGWFRAPGPAG